MSPSPPLSLRQLEAEITELAGHLNAAQHRWLTWTMGLRSRFCSIRRGAARTFQRKRRITMRIAAALLALATSVATAAPSISDEFAAGFGGVPWGIDLAELIAKYPGGYEAFSTDPGGVCYSLNIDDPVLGISRQGHYVVYGIGAEGKVEAIGIQVAYDQTANLISAVTSRFGPPKHLEGKGLETDYRWPVDRGMTLSVRTTNNRAYGLTTLTILNLRPRTAAR
jgi:hypothetical protein